MKTQTAKLPPGTEVLRPFVDVGIFDAGEIQLCATFARLQPGTSDDVLLALAVAARGPRRGHVCIVLGDVEQLVVDRNEEHVLGLPWPELDRWTKALSGSDLVSDPIDYLRQPVRPLVWDGSRLYLQRYFRHELMVAEDLTRRAQPDRGAGVTPDPEQFQTTLDALFGADDPSDPNLQRQAALQGLTQRLAVIAGGPGTGKTRTIARLLAAAYRLSASRGEALSVALTAPTGKAAARMIEALHLAVTEAEGEGIIDAAVSAALHEAEAVTLHRLLGSVPGAGFRRNARNPLPHDVVIVDETSMVSLPLMAHLLEALRPEARLLLVGDPFQLSSVEAGSVMSDVVGPEMLGTAPTTGEVGAATESSRRPLAGHVTVLSRSHRFERQSAIGALAVAVRRGDADGVLDLLSRGRGGATWIPPTDRSGFDELLGHLVAQAVKVVKAAEAGDAETGLSAMDDTRVLAATRHRPFGLYDWTRRIEEGIQLAFPSVRTSGRWYVGRPVIVTANDHPNHLSNGDTGLLVHRHGPPMVAFRVGTDLRYVSTSQLDRIDTLWATTVHKSQGSEFPRAVVSLPAESSPVLTRELLYTAITRAKEQVTVVGSEESIREAVNRPVARASGLGERLWPLP